MSETTDIAFIAPDGTEPDDVRRAFSVMSYRVSKAFDALTKAYERVGSLEDTTYAGGLEYSEGLNQLSILVGPGLIADTEGELINQLRVDAGDGLKIGIESQLEVSFESLKGLAFDDESRLAVQLAPGLKFDEEGKIAPQLDPLLGITAGGDIYLNASVLSLHPGLDADDGVLALDNSEGTWKYCPRNKIIPQQAAIAYATYSGGSSLIPNDSSLVINSQLKIYFINTDTAVADAINKLNDLIYKLRLAEILPP